MRRIIVALIIIAALLVVGCSKGQTNPDEFICPDKNQLDYDEQTDTYIRWINCMPSPDAPNRECSADEKYVAWVNENCGFKLAIEFAV